MIEEFTKGAAEAYARLINRYPLTDRADDAKTRLLALKQPVPTPTKAAIAQNKAEEDSRKTTGMFGHLMANFSKHPDVAQATKVGDPTLVDPKMVSAAEVVQQATRAMAGKAGSGSDTVSVETVNNGAPAPNEPAPRSDQAPAAAGDSAATPAAGSAPSTGAPPGEPTPNGSGNDSNELKPNVSGPGGQTPPPSPQVNEIQEGSAPGASSAQSGTNAADDAASSSSQAPADSVASSKHKKKKGLKKLIPF